MNFLQLHRPALFIFLFSLNCIVYAANIEEGKTVASACLSCHGEDGNSKIPLHPSLAGQRPGYLRNQLQAFQSGQRENAMMQNMAANLSKQDIENVSAYFASLSTKSAGGQPSLVKSGEEKSAMCKGCHGASAQGRGDFPKLAGQQPAYLESQLMKFKDKTRKGGPMNTISSSLTEQDIKEIAAYLGSL